LAETALWLLPEVLACADGAKVNVPFAGRHKIELKKLCGGENKKYKCEYKSRLIEINSQILGRKCL
jgi:hypothetical protein